MMTLENLVRTPLARALGWTLFHSLWEGAVVALILLGALCVIRSARLRYTAACVAALVILAGFASTLFCLLPGKAGALATIAGGMPPAARGEYGWLPEISARLRATDALPWLTPFWAVGVVLFQTRSLVSWIAARRIRSRGICCAPDHWLKRLAILRETMRVSKPVALLESCLTDLPVIVGYLYPAILTPVGMLAGMPANQIEAILLHELAHIRRRDYLANLAQMMVESFLFYHPAIWWISGVIRAERENCCDDLVVASSVDPYHYAAALTALEENRWAAQEAALAATGGNLVKRIRRLLNPLKAGEGPRAVLTPVLCAAILAVTAAMALSAWQTQAPAQSPNAPQVAWWQKWLDEDVVYIIQDQERNAFLKLTSDEERRYFVDQFWERRDPTPGTVENEFKNEHYRRLGFVSRFASRSGVAGWKTDRGRIYIVYGPPDQIESHPAGDRQPGSPPSETWLYRYIEGVGANISVEFVDKDRTGEFRMTTDPHPEGGQTIPRN
jgi:GWxTD domain-containing protein